MTHVEFEELAAAYSLGALSEEEKQRFKSLLNAPSEEQQQLIEDFDTVTTLLGIVAQPIAPRPRLKNQLLDIVKKEAAPEPDNKMAGFSFVLAHEGHWEPLTKGVSAKVLYKESHDHPSTMLLRMEAGSQLEGHAHAMMEELYMLEGDCHYLGTMLHAGDYHRAEPGSTHDITSTEQGCLMLVICRSV